MKKLVLMLIFAFAKNSFILTTAPSGTYTQTCPECSYTGDCQWERDKYGNRYTNCPPGAILTCKCIDNNGFFRQTSASGNRCWNDNGNLKCN